MKARPSRRCSHLKPLADLDATWGNNAQHAAGHTKNVYQSFNRL